MTLEAQTVDPLAEEELSPFAFLRPELDRVENLIREQASKFDPAVEPYVAYILNTSGKRIRPALTFLSGGATGEVTDEHNKLAVVLELIHVATLVSTTMPIRP